MKYLFSEFNRRFVLLILLFNFTAAYADEVPHTVAFSVDYPHDVKPFMSIDVNGSDYVTYRSKGITDIVGYRAKSANDSSMYVQIDWYDTLSDQYYRTKTIKIDPSKLAQFDIIDPGYVKLTIWLGRNGLVRVATRTQEFMNLMKTRHAEKITDEIAKPVILEQFCADSYEPSAEEKSTYDEMSARLSKRITSSRELSETQPASETICE